MPSTRSLPSRKPLMIAVVGTAVAVLGYFGWSHLNPAHSHDHDSAHDHDNAAVLSLDNGKPWATDEPLRQGIQRIRDAVASTMESHGRGDLRTEQAKALATAVEDNVNFLIQNCKLEPKADAVLHVFITDLLSGSAMVGADPASHAGFEKLAQALREYPKYFDHPGWTPIPQ